MRHVENDQRIERANLVHGEGPGDSAAPVMSDQDTSARLQGVEHIGDIRDQVANIVGRNASGAA